MAMSPSRSIPAVVALSALLLGPVAAFAQTSTLGQLAQKEQERRKALKTPGKVLTNQDLPKTTPPPTPATLPAGTAPKDAAAEAAKAAAKPEEPPKDEAWWRQRMAQAREELRRNEMFADALQTRINSLTNDFSARDDPAQRMRIGEDRVKALAELDRVQTDVNLGKKKIADIEEEARQAGVPPGWLR